VACISAEGRINTTNAGYIIEPGTEWLAYNTSMGYDGWQDASESTNNTDFKGINSERCLYEIDIITVFSLNNWFSTFFDGNMFMRGSEDAYTRPGVLAAFFDRLLDSPSLDTIDSNDSIFGKIAAFLTVLLRQNRNASNPATGSVFRSETCVYVRWGWLPYPLTMVLLSFVFFVSIIFGVRRQQDGGLGWKSSPLALVYHGLEEKTLDQYELEKLDNIESMVKAAEQLQVRLVRTRKGWELVS
jgi:hypothetical protein